MKGSEYRVFRFSVEKNAIDDIFRGPLMLPRSVDGPDFAAGAPPQRALGSGLPVRDIDTDWLIDHVPSADNPTRKRSS